MSAHFFHAGFDIHGDPNSQVRISTQSACETFAGKLPPRICIRRWERSGSDWKPARGGGISVPVQNAEAFAVAMIAAVVRVLGKEAAKPQTLNHDELAQPQGVSRG
jgi:hypothetical protein